MQHLINHALPLSLAITAGAFLEVRPLVRGEFFAYPPISPGANLCRKTRETFIEACSITATRAHSYRLFSRPNLGAGDFHSAALMHPLSEIRIRASLYPLPNPHPQQSQRQRTKKPTCQEIGNLESQEASHASGQYRGGIRILFRSPGILIYICGNRYNRYLMRFHEFE